MLVLWDIDGTLLHGAPRAHVKALAWAMARVWGVPATAADVTAIRPAGRTDQEIARAVLTLHGVPGGEVTPRLPEWMALAAARHEEIERLHPAPAVAPGAAAALEAAAALGARQALLTGNLEPIGRAKMARAGLAGFFPVGQGAFGSDDERRERLVPVAAARARVAAGDVVVVGDTPRDIRCAHAAGARCVAVATGPHPAGELADADAVVPDLAGAVAALAAAAGPRASSTRS